MNTLILTAYNDAMAPIGDLTSPLMLEYANRHGFDFRCVRQFREADTPYWQKVDEIIRGLRLYQRVLWLDADQVVTNPEFKPPWITGFHASMDWGTDAVDASQFSACGMLVCEDMKDMFEFISMLEKSYKDVPFPEQAALRQYYLYDDCRYRIQTHPRRVFNAVPVEIEPEAPEPWQPGDFCAHLTHVPVERRVEVFHIIREQITP